MKSIFRFRPTNHNTNPSETLVDHVDFNSEYPIGLWKNYFEKPLQSPVALSLSIGAVSDKALPWIRSFDRLVKLSVNDKEWKNIPKPLSLAKLHGVSQALKSLRLVRRHVALSEVFNFICSFPNLEDIELNVKLPFETELRTAILTPSRPTKLASGSDSQNPPSIPSKLTGTLELYGDVKAQCEINSVITKLLAIPGGLHFSHIKMVCPLVIDKSAMNLVSSCSHNLKTLLIDYAADRLILWNPVQRLDLSSARKLECLELRWNRPEVKWITETLGTIKHTHTLRRVTISVKPDTAFSVPAEEWYEFDDLVGEFKSKPPVAVTVWCNDILRRLLPALPPPVVGGRKKFLDGYYYL